MSKKQILLTGDRPTGPLHIGHYIGSLAKRVELQESCETYIMIADTQALTDNYNDVGRVRTNILEVACDYLAVGIDPEKSHIFVQSKLPELPELAMYYMNLVTIQRIGHNPTVKAETRQKGFTDSVPAGFYLYPIYQVADITAFRANLVPVGVDQEPMLELTRDVVRRFNEIYKTDVLVVPKGIFPESEKSVPGIDGLKMSKSLNNAIYLSDDPDAVQKKVKKMKSDSNRTSIDDPGDPENSLPFTYLDLFDPDRKGLGELKDRYRNGGLGDKVIKDRLVDILVAFLEPIRKKRAEYHKDPEEVFRILQAGTKKAKQTASETLTLCKRAMGIDYL
jgi:tryptophanyl-tRNA synthetase